LSKSATRKRKSAVAEKLEKTASYGNIVIYKLAVMITQYHFGGRM